MTRRIATVVTARASYARIKSFLEACLAHEDVEVLPILAGSALLDRYGDLVDIMTADGLAPEARVHMLLEGSNLVTAAKSTGLGVMELATVFENLRPDAVVTVADRYETMATAVAASYMNIPLVHVQGGEVTGNIDEKVRHSVTKLADLHLVSTQRAHERVVAMGENPEAVHLTGCPSIDLAAHLDDAPVFDPVARYGGVGDDVDLTGGYVIVMQHPVTTHHREAQADVGKTLDAMQSLDLPKLWFWPNPDAGSDGTSRGIRRFREQTKTNQFHFFKNMPPEDFLRLVRGSACIVGNSSVAIRECSYLGVPAVNVGDRQAGRERAANVVDVPHDVGAIREATLQQIRQRRFPRSTLYGDGHAGPRMAEVLATASFSIDKRLRL